MTSLTGTEELAGPLSAEGIARSTVAGAPLGADELNRIDAFWRACKYLALGMIYLQENPLLREPLKPEHIKSRLLGHWGSSPGLAFIYTHLSRLIKRDDLEMIFLAGPGHGAPGVLAPIYLEGTYSEIYPEKSEDEKGLREFFKQFSFPGGIGSHCTPETPGSIHEGGELGYVLSHACGAAFDNPQLIVAAVVGDGEAETGPLATSWHISKFLNPIRDGAVLPILHLNGYKINNPTLLARITHQELEDLFRGYGWNPYFVEGSDHDSMHQAMAATLERCIAEIKTHQEECRKTGVATRPRWPMVVLRSPKGWGAPAEVDGRRIEGFWRSHQVPMADVKTTPEHLHILENWMRSLKPEELFDEYGRVLPELAEIMPSGRRRMSASPHANAELRKKLRLPEFRDYAVKIDRPGNTGVENVPPLGRRRWSWQSTTRRTGSVLRSTQSTASQDCSGSAPTPKKNFAIARSHADIMPTSTGSTVLRSATGSGLTTRIEASRVSAIAMDCRTIRTATHVRITTFCVSHKLIVPVRCGSAGAFSEIG